VRARKRTDEHPIGAAAPSRSFVRRTWIACSVAGLAAAVAWSVNIGHAIGLLVAPLATLTLALAVLSVRWYRRRDTIDPRRDLAIPGAVLLALLAAREGLLFGGFEFDVSWFSSNANTTWVTKCSSTYRSVFGSVTSGASGADGKSRIEVTIDGSGGAQVSSALRDALLRESWRCGDVKLDVDFDAPSSWCFVPLYKHSVIEGTAKVKGAWRSANANGNVDANVLGTVDLTVRGIASRRTFNQQIAGQFADKIAEIVNGEIAKTQ
jgi:hypothetical protein